MYTWARLRHIGDIGRLLLRTLWLDALLVLSAEGRKSHAAVRVILVEVFELHVFIIVWALFAAQVFWRSIHLCSDLSDDGQGCYAFEMLRVCTAQKPLGHGRLYKVDPVLYPFNELIYVSLQKDKRLNIFNLSDKCFAHNYHTAQLTI